MYKIRKTEIDHKTGKFSIMIFIDFILISHIRKHVFNKNEFWDEWISENNLKDADNQIRNICFQKSCWQIATTNCKNCRNFRNCFEIMDHYQLINKYINVLTKTLKEDAKRGPRHTHHSNFVKRKKEMYYLGDNGVFIVNGYKKSNKYFLVTGYRCIKNNHNGSIYDKLKNDIKFRQTYFMNNAKYKIKEKIAKNEISIGNWCTIVNWGAF